MTRATGADLLVDALRRRVLSGELAPGAPLREEAIAEEHGLSRHTVRRALERLVAERLLESEPYRGVRVAAFADADVVALQQLRAALESEAVRLIRVEHGDVWPAAVVEPLEAALSRLETTGSVEEAHAELHRLLVAAAGSPRITEAYARLDAEMLLFLRQLAFHYDAQLLCREHRAYLDDVQRVGEQAVRDHLDRSTAMLLDARR
ncbi:GntR family transcriptional regulator [Aeromicrobium stalagmiti]|uniref:GntR family transcriptional regulator n=1 Tax=Aeromicrobium stalagmiti TaxID=2738988 RepID=UPI001569825F|nr:GntR family transcriptional regulator [Aeromicrobium stalagmiti]NRQ51105.1 GntR family transcriptional regulator [Aeromicrobium stalagmiti]